MSSTDFLFCAAQASGSREVGGDEAPATPVDRDGLCRCEFVGKRFPGADKYLGGVRSSSGAIYAIPGHAKRVLQIVGDDVRLVGPAFEGKYKWLRGVAARDGCVYAIPCHAERVLRIAPPLAAGEDPEVSLVGPKLPGLWKWHGAVEDPASGRVYAIPQSAEQVLRITPSDAVDDDGRPREPAVELVGPVLPGRWKFYGGLYSSGAIYGVPACATGVLRIGLDPAEAADGALEDVSLIGDVPAGGWKWHGGCVTADGCVWGIPSNSASVLKIAPKSGVYCIPSDADRVLRIDPATSEATYVGLDLSHLADGQSRGQNKWQNGYCAAADGCVYAIPLKCETVLKIDPTKPPDDCVSTVGGPFPGLNLWEGGVVGLDGALAAPQVRPRACIAAGHAARGRRRRRRADAGPWWSAMVGCL
ncbi:hypothetical protein JL721_8824 [Aureococcus anophagefferens]|nr:hypothetical protein JL721_8824 [Aureococcus anophagefferens]